MSGQNTNTQCFIVTIPVYSRQIPHDIDTSEDLTFGPFGNVEQEWIKGQEYEAHTDRVGQEVTTLERPQVDPGGLVEDGSHRSRLRGRVRSAE